MPAWGFVFLAYGVVWSVILLYVLHLHRRRRSIETELALYQDGAPQEPSEEPI